MPNVKISIPRVWRSELPQLLLFLVACGATILLSHYLPGSVVKGPLFSYGEKTLFLHLPLFWLVPVGILSFSVLRIFDVKYTLDGEGIEAVEGLLGFRKTVARVNYEDIRGIESNQTIIERLLDVGSVSIGTAATGDSEIRFSGIASPLELKTLIRGERDKRKEKFKKVLERREQMSPQSQSSP